MRQNQTITSKSSELYETDFYAWTIEQAQFLRDGSWNNLDVPNLIEEIESLGKQERQKLRNRLAILFAHLLKWEFQPSHRSHSWLGTIKEQRRRIIELLEENPSLKPYLPEAKEKAYLDGLDLAVQETSMSYKVFPSECPYELNEVLDFNFFPGEESDILD
ncbi:DUF29 domain-containing protein [Phormidium sp. LEGE 05292]|uniref:DUF29 domain-containing protein n=1 Tax=[Phormidium] sp. LEGE 05292 TaxID=767427 RepID=UPI00187F0396|nr:DUF29 domain-containing protein [Phormidium sp. LEGE 05292]MBE9229324.1 DUF29 domain-containing protein [Phormidium sp. LEGE 05292]